MRTIRNFFSNPIIKFIKKVISWIILLVLILLAVVLIYYVIGSKISEIKGKNYTPGVSLYTIISPSMVPNINVYDIVVTKKVKDFSEIKEGDVITFISNSSFGDGLTVTHRVKSIIKTDNDIKFRTKGDNNSTTDPSLVSSSNVLGKVVLVIPWLGHIQFLLQSKGGWIFALLIPALAVVVYDVVKVMRLSSIKQKVSASISDKPEDEELINKKKELKRKLKNKYFNIVKKDKEEFIEKEETIDEPKQFIEAEIAKEEFQEEVVEEPKEKLEEIKEEHKKEKSNNKKKKNIRKEEEKKVIKEEIYDENDLIKVNTMEETDIVKRLKQAALEEQKELVDDFMEDSFDLPKRK